MRGLEAQSREKMEFIFYLLLCIYKYDSCGWDPPVKAAELRKESSWADFLPTLTTLAVLKQVDSHPDWIALCLFQMRICPDDLQGETEQNSHETRQGALSYNRTNRLWLYLTRALSASCDQRASCLGWRGWECWPQLGYAEKAVWDQGSYSSWREWHVFCPYSTLYRSCTFHHWRWTCKRKESVAVV